MERDLRVVREKRIERDRANGIVHDPTPSKDMEETAEPAGTVPEKDTMIDEPKDQSELILPVTEPAAESVLPNYNKVDENTAKNPDQIAVSTIQDMPQDSADSLGLAITLPTDTNPESEGQPKELEGKPTAPTSEVKEAAELPLDMQGAEDFDFESMFNDNDMASADEALNFDFALPTDSAMNRGLLTDGNFEGINVNNTANSDITSLPVNANEDIEGVLPGLENYLNADTDFSNMGMSSAVAPVQASQAPDILAEQTVTTTGEPVTKPETSFDDFFGDFDMGGTEDLGDGTLNDLDNFDWS